VTPRSSYRTAFADLGDTGTKFAIVVVPARSGRTTSTQRSQWSTTKAPSPGVDEPLQSWRRSAE
jgi:hypothetical protein